MATSFSDIEYLNWAYQQKLRDMQRYYDQRQSPPPMYIAQTTQSGVTQILNTHTGEVKKIEESPKVDDKLKNLIAYYYHRK
jgi:hypothetical protein